ncbi:MAG TPA: GWxTD domain-containing protein [Blastocatellia bacterium]|nr:GWxTD domain-containing protein [Blastocatellia bacterium]
MKRDSLFNKLCFGISLLLLLIPSPSVFGSARHLTQDQDKSEKPQKDHNAKKKKEELKSVYKKWIEEDVAYIITDEERRAFKALKTDEERDQFIEAFWLRRDPDPDTPENEYKDEYYRRIQYANEHFASGIPGWKTDRGRIYIMFGKPDEIESHPAGGPYDRPSYEGGGTTETYPFEDWWYRYIDGVGSDIEIEFVDPTGSGEYRIAQNPEEKDALLYVPGAGQTLAEQLGLATQADRVQMAQGFGMPGGNLNMFGGRAKDQEFEVLQKLHDLQKPPPVKFADLQVKASLPEIATDVLPFSVRTDFMRISSESVVTSFTMQLDNADLSFKNEGGISNGTVNIYAKITNLSGRQLGQFEDVISTDRFTDSMLAAGQKERSIYQKNLPLPPGRYKIDVVARDVNSGKTGVIHHSFVVPRYSDNTLSTSSLVLAASIQSLSNKTIHGGSFVMGDYKVEPYVSGVYKPNQNLALYLQVYDAEMDQATLKPALKVEYKIWKGSNTAALPVLDIVEDGKSRSGYIDMRGQQLTVVRAIPVQGAIAEPGTYTIQVKVTDLVAQKDVTPQASFTVVSSSQ